MSKLRTVIVNGLLPTIEFQRAKCCAEDLHKKHPALFAAPVINAMLEFEWSLWLDAKKQELRGESWAFMDPVLVYLDNQIIGACSEFLAWAIEQYNYDDFRNDLLYETLRSEAYAKHIEKDNSDFVYLDFAHDNNELGRLVIELFKNEVPKASENFRLLCSGELGRAEETLTRLHYKNTVISRIVPQGWIQGGDIISGKGNTNESVFGGLFEDESFAIQHNRRGIVGMANNGRHTNGSQFYITLQPAPWMNKKYVAFGRVVEGSQTLKELEKIGTQNQRPLKECKIIDSGIFTYVF